MTRPFPAIDDALGRVVARLPDWPVPAPEGLAATLDELGWRTAPEGLARLAAACGLLALLAFPALAVAPLVGVVAVTYAVAAGYAVLRVPDLALALHESRVVGAGPAFVARLALRVRLDPSAEAAAAFAARTGDGPLADALARRIRATAGTPETALDAVTADLSDPGLRRAVALVHAAVETPAADRGRVLDRALAAARDATERHVREGVRAVRGPVNAVYAFGVVLPLALVGLVPVAPAAGVALPLGAVALVYDVFLPLALLSAAAWVLAHRPAVFPAGRADAAVGVDRRRAAGLGLGAALLAAVGTLVLDVAWALPVTAPCCGVGVALAVAARPAVDLDDHASAVSEGLPDAVAVVGRRLAGGDPPETAVAAAGTTIPGPTGELFAAADRTRRALGRPLEDAFFGRHGVVGPEHGTRVSGTLGLLLDAASGGRAGGRVLAEVADGLDAVQRLENDARADLADLADTLVRTGGLFAPVVAGVTVTLAGHVGSLGDATGSVLPVASLGLAVGVYVAWSAVVLTALGVCLDGGVRRAQLAVRVGTALATAGACYACAAAAAALLL
ncbi:pilus assembly protein [Halarchaeum sp. CBA1220]|uniref:pilus assembly protein n=1 Tax=Halarchaeum sp. CBA1220 TaxID=1853682 RepID=UPI000F3A8CD1|nr:pilus assembly protein [Halarchaeum sp. CBA1220]QLC33754.1 pilus assembly protein [Halarchaeum sp. CBA1220]